ncbi:MAG: hypothetical protein QOF60_1791 [Actinomycetota bacterium]|jgi:glycosyltransferase involved in cell wall biosynthesis|nr:hypothetical protein [Actinomycetota bacterium]
MRLLILNWRDRMHPQAGGAEVYTDEVARHWAASGHDVTLFSSHASGLAHHEVDGRFQVVRRGGPLSVYSEARRYYRREGIGRFDLVIDEVNTRPFFASKYVRDVPVVALIHQVAREVWDSEFPFPIGVVGRRWLEPRWLSHYERVPTLTVSASSAASLRAYGLQNISVVPEGLRPLAPAVPVTKEAKPTLVFVGRMAANKRPDHAIEAFVIAREKVRELRLWMVGSGAMLDKLAATSPDGVTFFGRVDDLTKLNLVGRAHAIVATSVREGWGLMISEAAAVGTSAIAYDAPGLVDSVTAANGVLVASRPDAVAAEVIRQAPTWTASASVGWDPGTRSWEDVAEIVLARAEALIGGRSTQRRPDIAGRVEPAADPL